MNAIGDEPGHIARRRHIERGVERGHPLGRHRPPGHHRDFRCRALLDRNQVTLGKGGVDAGPRRRTVERHAVMTGEHGEPIGPNLVCKIAVGADAVCTDKNDVDSGLPHQCRGGRIGDQRGRHTRMLQLPGGEA